MLESIKEAILDAFESEAEVHVLDPREDGMHLEAIIVSPEFENLGPLERQQKVMPHLKDHFEAGLHALGMKTYTPKEWSAKNA